MEADVALAVLALSSLRVGGGDPEQRLAVAPARHVGILVFQLEAEEAEQLAVERLRALEVADAEHQVIDADDAGHADLRLLPPPRRLPCQEWRRHPWFHARIFSPMPHVLSYCDRPNLLAMLSV